MMDTNAKKKKVDDHHVGSDRLSDLPLSIIHIILALIPIREAVRTSVLSTQWRYTWTTLSQFVFYGDCPSRNKSVTMAVYSCKELTYLTLDHCILDRPPLSFKGFMFLRRLFLKWVDMSRDEIYSLVSLCPLLQSFELIEDESDQFELKISAPNLKYLHIWGEHQYIYINAPHVTEISVQMSGYLYATDQQEISSSCEYASCFAGFTDLQKLSGTGYFTKYLSFGIELSHHLLVFHHLKLISVEVKFEYVKEIMVLARLATGAPSLQELIIRSIGNESEAPHLSLEDLGFTSNFKLKNLTDVSLVHSYIRPLEARPMEMEFLKILFESSLVLETVRVDTEKNQDKVRAILQGCNWASPPIVKPCCKKRIADRFMFYW